MSYDGWVEFGGRELVNISRTAQLAATLGIDTVWTDPGSVQWIQDTLGGAGYDEIEFAPWYDDGYPASAEFAGFVPLSFSGLDDSTSESTPVEYVTDGGNAGRLRNGTLPIVASLVVVASTDRGAEYGKKYLDRILRGGDSGPYCYGETLRYFRYAGDSAPIMHRRDVKQTRGCSVTRKSRNDCSSTWWVTFTLTAADPYEYGESTPWVLGLGNGSIPFGPGLISSGENDMTDVPCAEWDYTPVFDPLYPALVPPPEIPNFYPAGWTETSGRTFKRFSARMTPMEPSHLNVVPTIVVMASEEARMVRIGFWPHDADPSDNLCAPLFAVMLTYVPIDVTFTIDGEAKASYVQGTASTVEPKRRADSLVYSPDAKPVNWAAFNDDESILMTIDIFSDDLMDVPVVALELYLSSKSD